MNKSFCLILISLAQCLYAIEPHTSNVTANDLASFLKINHKEFIVPKTDLGENFSVSISIYHNGKTIHKSAEYVRKTVGNERFSIMYKELEDKFVVCIKTSNNTTNFTIEKPSSINFSYVPHGISFDSKNRLVLSYDVQLNKEKEYRITTENSTAEGAYYALVFELQTHKN